jgi:hypothetical protein
LADKKTSILPEINRVEEECAVLPGGFRTVSTKNMKWSWKQEAAYSLGCSRKPAGAMLEVWKALEP